MTLDATAPAAPDFKEAAAPQAKKFKNVTAVYTRAPGPCAIEDFYFTAADLLAKAENSGAAFFVQHGGKLSPATAQDTCVFENGRKELSMAESVSKTARGLMGADDEGPAAKAKPYEKKVTDRGNVEDPYFRQTLGLQLV